MIITGDKLNSLRDTYKQRNCDKQIHLHKMQVELQVKFNIELK